MAPQWRSSCNRFDFRFDQNGKPVQLLNFSTIVLSFKYMQRTQHIKLTKPQERFVKRFIDIAYENMAIEKEMPFTRQEAYRRYRQDALDLVRDGTYKTIRYEV
jgi:hypothetical protein